MMKTLSFAIALLLFGNLHSQIILNIDDPVSDCEITVLGTTIDFERGLTCGVEVVILDENDFEVFRTSDTNFSYTFNELGEFTIYCGAGASAIAMEAICIQTSLIPTMSEWGVICLTILMLIVCVVSLKENRLLSDVALTTAV